MAVFSSFAQDPEILVTIAPPPVRYPVFELGTTYTQAGGSIGLSMMSVDSYQVVDTTLFDVLYTPKNLSLSTLVPLEPGKFLITRGLRWLVQKNTPTIME